MIDEDGHKVGDSQSLVAAQSDEALQEMLDAVHTLGEQLVRQQTMTALRHYRDAVQGFMHSVVDQGFTAETRTSGATILKRKRYTIVDIVNSKLSRLAEGLVQSQQRPLELMAAVEEIRGLLIDLHH